jgi:hypothetical protein
MIWSTPALRSQERGRALGTRVPRDRRRLAGQVPEKSNIVGETRPARRRRSQAFRASQCQRKSHIVQVSIKAQVVGFVYPTAHPSLPGPGQRPDSYQPKATPWVHSRQKMQALKARFARCRMPLGFLPFCNEIGVSCVVCRAGVVPGSC